MKNLIRGPKTREKILIVDDDRLTLVLLTGIFKKEYDVFTTTKGSEAVDLANDILPDLILLDVMMPDVDGYKVGIKLKANPNTKDIPLIFITSLDSPQNETLGLKIGAIDYIHKPINPVIVNLRIHNHLEMKRQKDVLLKLTYLDGLTGCYNRRWFDQLFPTLWNSCAKDRKPLTLFFLDIDFFKLYNDAYGHLAGDDCLKLVVEIIYSILKRPTNVCARYNSDSFIGILFQMDLLNGENIGEKICCAVSNSRIPHENNPHKIVTVSIGIATAYPGVDKNYKDLLSLSDQMLQKAKDLGGNQISSESLPLE